MKKSICIGLLLAVAALTYGNSLRNSFTLDDTLYVQRNPAVMEFSVRGLFTPDKFTQVFRPVTFATMALNWAVSGDRPFGYHLVNLLLHAAATLLLYLLLLEIFPVNEPDAAGGAGPPWQEIAFAAALLFAVHPIHAEAVASIVGRAELLAAGFLFAGWILHLRGRQFAALACFALAMLSKESAVVFLPLVLLGDYARGAWKPSYRYGLMAACTAAYLGLRWKVRAGSLGQLNISELDNPLAKLPGHWRILNATRVAWRYAALQAYPAKLSCDYSFNQIPVYLDWRHTLPAALAAAAVVAAWVWAIRKRRGALMLAGALYLGGFAISANMLAPTGTIMGERLAYLPSAGFCLLAAMAWGWLKKRQRMVAIAVATAVVAGFAMRTVVRNRDWKDNLSLFASSVQAAPNSAKLRADLGYEYLLEGRLDAAGPQLEAALRIEPDYPDAQAAYGLLQAWIGNYQAAGSMMEQALAKTPRMDPNYDFMAVNLAAVLIQTGHIEGALDLLNREITESPRYSRAWSNRAVVHYRQGDAAPARSDAQQALRLDRENVQAQNLIHLLDNGAEPPTQR